MGVDYKYDNKYWDLLSKKYSEQLNIIPFTTDSKKRKNFIEMLVRFVLLVFMNHLGILYVKQ